MTGEEGLGKLVAEAYIGRYSNCSCESSANRAIVSITKHTNIPARVWKSTLSAAVASFCKPWSACEQSLKQ